MRWPMGSLVNSLNSRSRFGCECVIFLRSPDLKREFNGPSQPVVCSTVNPALVRFRVDDLNRVLLKVRSRPSMKYCAIVVINAHLRNKESNRHTRRTRCCMTFCSNWTVCQQASFSLHLSDHVAAGENRKV